MHTLYFRLSLTDKCNLKCYFCHKEGQDTSAPNPLLDANDFVWASEIAIKMGFKKFKLTGGEPTLRSDLPLIVKGIKEKGAEDVSIVTNGLRLQECSQTLFDAGLDRLNVSIYSFRKDVFKDYCKGREKDIERLKAGIDVAMKSGFHNIKINFILNNFNRLDEFEEVLLFARDRRLRVLLLPRLRYNNRPDDFVYFYDDFYNFVKGLGIRKDGFGIRKEEIITDSEGFSKKLLHLDNGAAILLRFDTLASKNMFKACSECLHKDECLEGICPLRLSAYGNLLPCLSKGIGEVMAYDIIKSRNEEQFIKAIKSVSML